MAKMQCTILKHACEIKKNCLQLKRKSFSFSNLSSNPLRRFEARPSIENESIQKALHHHIVFPPFPSSEKSVFDAFLLPLSSRSLTVCSDHEPWISIWHCCCVSSSNHHHHQHYHKEASTLLLKEELIDNNTIRKKQRSVTDFPQQPSCTLEEWIEKILMTSFVRGRKNGK